MKTKQTTNGMYALLVVVAAFLATGIYFACSADDDFETNYEMETLAKGEIVTSIEPGDTPASFVGDSIAGGSRIIENIELYNNFTVDIRLNWSSGYTGTVVLPHSDAYVEMLNFDNSYVTPDSCVYERDRVWDSKYHQWVYVYHYNIYNHQFEYSGGEAVWTGPRNLRVRLNYTRYTYKYRSDSTYHQKTFINRTSDARRYERYFSYAEIRTDTLNINEP